MRKAQSFRSFANEAFTSFIVFCFSFVQDTQNANVSFFSFLFFSFFLCFLCRAGQFGHRAVAIGAQTYLGVLWLVRVASAVSRRSVILAGMQDCAKQMDDVTCGRDENYGSLIGAELWVIGQLVAPSPQRVILETDGKIRTFTLFSVFFRLSSSFLLLFSRSFFFVFVFQWQVILSSSCRTRALHLLWRCQRLKWIRRHSPQ